MGKKVEIVPCAHEHTQNKYRNFTSQRGGRKKSFPGNSLKWHFIQFYFMLCNYFVQNVRYYIYTNEDVIVILS